MSEKATPDGTPDLLGSDGRRSPDVERHRSHDAEKNKPILAPGAEDRAIATSQGGWKGRLFRLEQLLVRYNLEERGIQRVMPEHRHDLNHLGLSQIFLLWFSVDLMGLVVTIGMLGPAVYYLPFLDASLCAVFGMLAGTFGPAYVATFGPRAGLRTMVVGRFVMGWYPAKLVVLFTLVNLIGYTVLNVVVAGQILNAVSPNGSLSLVVGIVIVTVITWVVSTFGYSIVHYYERYCWIPQLIVFMILAGAAGPKFDLYGDPGAGLGRWTNVGDRLSFFSLCFSAFITYCPDAADFFVYYPENTPQYKVFLVVFAALALSGTPMLVLGVGLGSGIASNPKWAQAYDVSEGALIVEGFRPLGGFGLFCSVVVALGLVSNAVPAIYASGINWQVLGKYFKMIPRIVWNFVSVIIFLVCAIAGREHLADILTNVLSLMGYYASIFVVLLAEEHVMNGARWDWNAWNDRRRLPVGWAAFVAFAVGYAGAVLCMDQVYFVGPIAAQIGKYGGDLGNYVGAAFAGLIYPPLRWIERRKFGR